MGGRVASGRSSNPEHGDDANGGALRDVMLLAQGDVMIGTFLSSFTLLVQELIAARAAADARTALAHPSVIYCGTGAVSIGEERSRRSPNSRCSPPQPLLPTLKAPCHWGGSRPRTHGTTTTPTGTMLLRDRPRGRDQRRRLS